MSECKQPEETEGKPARFFWRGKRVTEKVYKRRCLDQKLAKNLRNIYGTKRGTYNLKKDKVENDGNCEVVEGRRIVHVKTLGDQMFCRKCKSILSLQDIISEKRHGLASVFDIKCRNCKVISKVETDKKHVVCKDTKHDASDQNCSCKSKQCLHYDTNTKGVV
ncbi:PREDICTED: uncharacterized protein LOC105570884, partial [Vollenhovia emeryi]|uniref:uncharacterized protein LOC105570884 n=1 Tax=Vollenhovia emeryi TaxID=411798 RepID=UPI0005F405DB